MHVPLSGAPIPLLVRRQMMADTPTTGGEWKSKADTMRDAKLDNACSEPITQGEMIPWAKLDNRERPASFAQ